MRTCKIAVLVLVLLPALPASGVGETGGAAERPGAVAPDPRAAMDLPENAVRTLLRRGGYPGAQVGLIEQIEKRGRVEFLPELVGLLADDHAEVREASSRALASFGWERASDPLLVVLESKKAPTCARVLAAGTLGAMGRAEAVEPLLVALDDPAVAPAATKALEAITFQELPDADAWRRWWTENKGRTRIEWAAARIDELKRLIEQDGKDDEAARKRAAELDDRLGDAAVRFLDARADRGDSAALLAALDTPSLKVKRYAATELGKLKAKEAVAKLTERATAVAEDATLRADCAAALGNIAAPESAETLKGLLCDASDLVAASAASALGRMKAAGATEALLTALKHRAPGVRGAAAEALGRTDVAAALEPLGELLAHDGDASVRERAARALGETGDARSRAALEKGLSDDSAAVRVYVVEALGQIGVPEVATRLGEVLERDASPSVRESAAVALGRIGCKDAIGPLLRAADGDDAKLASLAWSGVLAACRRDDALAESTADDLATAGKTERATALYEVAEKSLVDRKDEPRLVAARLKLADGWLALKQPAKAAATLKAVDESLKGGLAVPDDVRAKIEDLRRRCAPPVEQKP